MAEGPRQRLVSSSDAAMARSAHSGVARAGCRHVPRPSTSPDLLCSSKNGAGPGHTVQPRLSQLSRYEYVLLRHTHTHTHPFNGPFSRNTRVSRYQKGNTNLDFTEARDSEWQWHQLSHRQVCTFLQTDNHASTPPISFLQAGCPSCHVLLRVSKK